MFIDTRASLGVVKSVDVAKIEEDLFHGKEEDEEEEDDFTLLTALIGDLYQEALLFIVLVATAIYLYRRDVAARAVRNVREVPQVN